MKKIPPDQVALYAFIGQKICAVREQRGWTQMELATRLGISRASLSNLERGSQRLLVNSLIEIATVLDRDASDFLPCRAEITENSDQLTDEEVRFVRALHSAASTAILSSSRGMEISKKKH